MKRIVLPLLAAVCAILFTACSDQKEEQLTTPETSSSTVATDTDWKTAYKEFLNEKGYEEAAADNLEPENVSFSLGSVDDDDIPELFVSNGKSHGASVSVFTYLNGEIKHLCTGGEYGNIRYFEKAGYITSYYCGQGTWTYDIYEFKNGECTKIHTAYDSLNATDEPSLQKLEIDGEEVSAEEMESFKEKYYSSSNENVKAIWGLDGKEKRISIDEENIETYIMNY